MHTASQQKNTIGHFLIGVAVGCCVVFFWPQAEVTPNNSTVDTLVATSTLISYSESEPVVLKIPKISLEATFETPLGLTGIGAAEVPQSYDEVGWYKYGPTPGEIGPAVILGHVDSVKGPAVFYSLGLLEVDDLVYVLREDGREVKFIVEKVERHEQSAFPTKEVYGDIPYAGLRLITCSGTYKKGEQRYTHNLVVYAKLVE